MTSPDSWSWKIPSLEGLIFLAVFSFLILDPAQLLTDGDTGFHIRAGEWMLQNLKFPTQDLFSFYVPTLPWSNHSWLSEVIMGGLHLLAGLRGVAALYALLISLLGYFLFRILNRISGNILAASLIGTLAFINTISHWHARPHIFSMLFMLIWLDGISQYLNQNKRWIFWVGPGAMLFWVNLHGGFLLGFVILGIILIGLVFEMGWNRDENHSAKISQFKHLGILLLTLIPIACMNPDGVHGLLYPLQMMKNQELMRSVDEYLPPNFHLPTFFVFQVFIFLWILLAGIKVNKLRAHEVLLEVLFLKMALFSKRHVPLFGLVSAYILTPHFAIAFNHGTGSFIKHFRRLSARLQSIQLRSRSGVWAIAGGAILLGLVFLRHEPLAFEYEKFPVKATDHLLAHPIKGNMFNDSGFGGYLIYRLWPQYKVFAYGYNDIRTLNRAKDYFSIILLKEHWEDVLKTQNISWLFISRHSVLNRMVENDPKWKPVYSDDLACIYSL